MTPAELDEDLMLTLMIFTISAALILSLYYNFKD